MSDIGDFFPLFDKDEDVVYAEMVARANAGVEPGDPAWVDVRVGSFFWLTNYPVAIAIAAAYSRMNEAAAAGIVATSWETYLDLHAESYGTERKAADYSEVLVEFSAPSGTLLPSGIRVMPSQTDPDVDPPIFETVASTTVPTPLGAPQNLTATAGAGLGGFVGNPAAGTYYYRVTALDALGYESAVSAQATATTTATQQITLNWDDVSGATGYLVYRGTVNGGPYGLLLAPAPQAQPEYHGAPRYAWATSDALDIGDDSSMSYTAGTHPPASDLTGAHAAVLARALEPGTNGNVKPGAIDLMDSAVSGVTAVVNWEAAAGGIDVETDRALKDRLAQRFEGGQGANVAWYEARALEEPGVGRVRVIPNWSGAGTVKVIVMDDDGRNAPTSAVDSLQDRLDPDPGQGAGQAPIDHDVTVTTPAVVPIDVTMSLTFKSGYSLDGDDGTVALRADVLEAVSAYIDGLTAGEDGVYNGMFSSPFEVEGVLNHATTPQWRRDAVAFGTGAIAISDSEVAATDAITLT